jgi:Spy/CpxP family protein refolding chaperone
MRRCQFFIAAVIVIIFVSSSSFAKMIESRKPRLPSKQQRLNKIQMRVNELNKKLNLKEAQKTQITDILTRVKEETVKLLEETGQKITQLKAAGEVEIEGTLTKEQRDKFNNVYETEGDEEDIVKIFRSSY